MAAAWVPRDEDADSACRGFSYQFALGDVLCQDF